MARLIMVVLVGLVFTLADALPLKANSNKGVKWGGNTLSIGLTPVIVDTDQGLKDRWGDYLSRKLEMKVRFIHRRSYQEMLLLVMYKEVDIAWICGYPFVREKDKLQLLTVPVYKGTPTYQSYVIVARDSPLNTLDSLKGKLHAFSDADSNSGHLVPRYLLMKRGTTPEQFFSNYIFTNSHENVIRSVAHGLTDSGSVDGYVWDVLNQKNKALAGKTKVIHRSRQYGFPPIVALKSFPEERLRKIREVLVNMEKDPEGKGILAALSLDRFSKQNEALYDGIAEIMKELNLYKGEDALAKRSKQLVR